MNAIAILILLAFHYLHLPTEAVIRRKHPVDEEAEKNGPTVSGSIKDVLAQTGGTAVLPCKFTDPGAGIVSWVRQRDRQLLTVGSDRHSMDKKFMVEPGSSDRSLLIRNVQHEDAGIYECQISTVPVQHRSVRLKITEAYSVIPGAPDFHVKQGSGLRLECWLKEAAEPPIYVFWYRQGRMINYDTEPGVKVTSTKFGSVLVVDKTKPSHGGNYTCAPNNAKPAYVMIHIIEEEEKPAAMHGGDRRSSSEDPRRGHVTILAIVLVLCVGKWCEALLRAT